MGRYADQVRYLRNEVIPIIRDNGWMCAGHVLPSGQHTGDLASTITYTVGLTEARLSELALVGLPHEPAAVLLNFLARMHLDSELAAGARVPMPNATELLLVDAPGVSGPVARLLYGRRVRFLQLLWPDGAGRYPTDPGWPIEHPQPVLDTPLPDYMVPTDDGLMAELDAAAYRQG